ncbi:hypothetical protein [Microbispora sp. H10836]|uniref:hypothetical protein n=1 Tax=Microbispora sp. H10836 TaxID=2729106 RepID=UPI0014734EF0|nr:hypothetical protein [Microbispora sp. H10836]
MSHDMFRHLRGVLDPIVPADVGTVAERGGDLLSDITDALRTDSRLLESVAARSYAHTNGFDRISLYNERDGPEVRIHLWWAGVPSDESIHNHAWDFSSLVLTGSLTFQILGQTTYGQSYDLYRSSMPAGGRPGDYEFTPMGDMSASVTFEATIAAGSFYRMDHDTYHRVLASPPSGAPLTATIVARGPVRRRFSQVLMPHGTPMPQRRSMRRLSGEEIVDKLDALRRDLK